MNNINKMDLQADINWLKQELDKVKDPHFLEALKGMFNYRRSKSNDRLTKEEFIADIKEAEDQIENGDYLSIDDFEREAKKWV